MKAGIVLLATLLVATAMPTPQAGAHSAPTDDKSSSATATVPAPISELLQTVLGACAKRRLLVVGELHGTNETEDLVAELVRLASARRPVRLGLEIPVTEQAAISTYLASTGSAADKVSLERGPFWGFQDGRASSAMLRLIDGIRRWRAAGRDVDIFTMEPDYSSQADVAAAGGALSFKEMHMAEAVQQSLEKGQRKTLVIALMGNYHSRYEPGVTGNAASVTERLAPASPYVLLPEARQTAAWNCMQSGCAVHSNTSTRAPETGLPKLVADTSTPNGLTITELWISSMTAAKPVKPAP